MLKPQARRWGFKRIAAVVAVLVFAGIGTYLLAAGRAATPDATRQQSGAQEGRPTPSAGGIKAGTSGNPLLTPLATGLTPYAYVPYGGVSMADYGQRVSTDQFHAAFILGSGCTPAWDGRTELGLASQRGRAVAADIRSVRDRGGDVSVSFGGESDTELSNSCTDPQALKAAYQSVIDAYKLTHINFDIEYDSESNQAAMARRVQAAKALQDANPGLLISLTVPVGPQGLVDGGLNTLKRFRDAGVKVSNVGIMAMIFGQSSGRQSDVIKTAIEGTVRQMRTIYPGISQQEAYRAVNLIVLLGDNTGGETFTVADAVTIRQFIRDKGVGTWGYWSANRDKPCGVDGADLKQDTCSGVKQEAGQFGKLLR